MQILREPLCRFLSGTSLRKAHGKQADDENAKIAIYLSI